MLAGPQAVGEIIRAGAVPAALVRPVKGHRVLTAVFGFQQVLPLEHLAFGDLEMLAAGAAFAVVQGLGADLLGGEEGRLVRVGRRLPGLTCVQQILGVEQHRHGVLAAAARIGAGTRGGQRPAAEVDAGSVIAVAAVHLVGEAPGFKILLLQDEGAVLVEAQPPFVDQERVGHRVANEVAGQGEHAMVSFRGGARRGSGKPRRRVRDDGRRAWAAPAGWGRCAARTSSCASPGGRR